MAKYDKTQDAGWGGPWTEQKLDCFESYVRAYLTIMNQYRDKYGWKLIYFDGFAGCGDREGRKQEEDSMMQLFPDQIEKEELRVYEGAAERVVKLEREKRGFDFYYFIDKYEENLNKLEIRLAKYESQGMMSFRADDANNQALMLGKALKDNAKLKSLCLLDPFGMSIDWETIENISGKSIDLWILIPTGSIVSRLLKNDGTLRSAQKLERFFGLPEEAIKERFYRKETQNDLFGEHEVTRKVEDSVQEIAELYCEQLGTLFSYVSNPLVMRNKKQVPIFHFVCASQNKTAVKIAEQIIEKRQER